MGQLFDETSAIQSLALTKFCEIQPRLMEALLTYYGNLDRIINADAGSLMAISGMTAEIANRITQATKFLPKAEEYYRKLASRDMMVVSRFEEPFPQRLFELNDPPSLLFWMGELPTDGKKSAALVGTTEATSKGIELTTTVAKLLAQSEVSVIASLNYGIDAAAHLGARAGGGVSYAVLESGFDHIHPIDHRPLAVDIVKKGGLISECSPEKKYIEGRYETSNRLIVALSQAVIVTEFYKESIVTLDLLSCCSQIGKLTFVIIDPRNGALTDQESLNKAVSYGAIPLVGLDKVKDIVTALV